MRREIYRGIHILIRIYAVVRTFKEPGVSFACTIEYLITQVTAN